MQKPKTDCRNIASGTGSPEVKRYEKGYTCFWLKKNKKSPRVGYLGGLTTQGDPQTLAGMV